MHIYFYKLTADNGGAPCVKHGLLSLAICKPAISLRDDHQALAQATPEQLARLLTVCIRQDRFCEGALESAFESGLLTRILERAAVLLRQLEPQMRS